MSIQTVNPSTGKVIQTYPEMSEEFFKEIIDQTYAAFLEWKNLAIAEKTPKLLKLAGLLRDRKKPLAELITEEMGKPISAAQAEIEKCAWVCEFYAQNAEEFLKPRSIATSMAKSYVTYEPLGVIFAIMPWNFPFWQVFRFAAPTLMAGNAALLKPAPISTGAGLAIEQLFRDAGFPENLFRTLVISTEDAAKVIKHSKVAAVTLTGSINAGKSVSAEAANVVKKAVLELGGNDPYIILEDADLEQAAEACVTSRMNNSGQVCIAAKRIIAVDAVRDEFQRLVLEKLKRYKMGNPMDENVNFGPLAREDLRFKVHKQVKDSITLGAKLVLGGEIPHQPGFYYPPTVLDNVKKGMPAYEEEVFGPVLSFIRAKDEAEAIKIANDSSYGLAGAVFTRDIKRGETIAAKKIQVGTCAVNTFVASDPRLPFGGIKSSGYGRELSEEGIRSFVNVKTINVG